MDGSQMDEITHRRFCYNKRWIFSRVIFTVDSMVIIDTK